MQKKTGIRVWIFIGMLIAAIPLSAQHYSDYELLPVGSEIYGQARRLFHEAGLQNFSRDYPMTVKEMQLSLARIPKDRLSSESAAVLQTLIESLEIQEPEGSPLELTVTVTAEAQANTDGDYTEWVDNTTKTYYEYGDETGASVDIKDKVYSSTDGNWEYTYKDRHVPVELDLEMPIAGFLYGRVDGSIGKDPFQVGVNNENYLNVPTAGEQVDLMAPYRAFVSGGAQHVYFQLGRDRLSWGNGVSGNMIMSDSPLFYDFFKFSWFHDKFKYSFVTVGLETWLLDRDFIYNPDGSLRDMTDADGDGTADAIEEAEAYYHQSKMFIGHRVEFYPFSNFYIAISENTIYGGKPFSLNYLNPFMLYHSYYVQGYGNSFLTLEMSYSPVRALNVYGQMGVDQFQTPMEVANGWGGDEEPGAMGYIAGVSYNQKIMGKPFTFGYEWAYTSPYLYYGNQYDHDQPYGGNSPVLAISSRRRVNSLTSPIKVNSYVDQSIGYFTGPDSVVHYFYVDFPEFMEDLLLGAEVTWLQKGERDMTTQFYVPTGRGSAAGPTGIVENKIISEVWFNKRLNDNISIGGQIDVIGYKNLNHQQGENGFDIQFGTFCSWEIL